MPPPYLYKCLRAVSTHRRPRFSCVAKIYLYIFFNSLTHKIYSSFLFFTHIVCLFEYFKKQKHNFAYAKKITFKQIFK